MTRVPLMRLTNQGLAAIDGPFLAGTPERLADDPSFATALPGRGLVSAASLTVSVEGTGTLRPEDDPAVAARLHAQLPIRRGLATDDRFWAWLAAVHCAPLLRRRWGGADKAVNHKRFTGGLTDNGLSRLWWAAELTSGPRGIDRAALTALLAVQYRTDRMLSMSILRHAPLLCGFVDALGDDTRWQVVNAMCQRLGVLATTYAVAAMNRDEARAFARRIYADVTGDPRDGP
jgi:hypothetical protein